MNEPVCIAGPLKICIMGDSCPACGGTDYYCAEEVDSHIEHLLAELEAASALIAELGLRLGSTYCAYCGVGFSLDAPDSAAAVGQHIATCALHPMRRVEADRDALLAACKAARANLESLVNDFGLGFDEPEEHPLIQKLDTAIAKAEGGNSD